MGLTVSVMNLPPGAGHWSAGYHNNAYMAGPLEPGDVWKPVPPVVKGDSLIVYAIKADYSGFVGNYHNGSAYIEDGKTYVYDFAKSALFEVSNPKASVPWGWIAAGVGVLAGLGLVLSKRR